MQRNQIDQARDKPATFFADLPAERKALKRRGEIVASCPINCVCSSRVEGSKRWSDCGWFQGTIRDHRGFRVRCNITEEV